MAATTHIGQTTFTTPSDTRLVATHEFEAPRELLWAAHTQCEHVQRWLLGTDEWTMPICAIDLTPGGGWRYVFEGPGGAGFQLSGRQREILAPERIVQTETLDDGPVETVNTLTLSEEGTRTILRTTVDYPSKEVREQIIATGMLDGWAESYDRLEEYLRSLGPGM